VEGPGHSFVLAPPAREPELALSPLLALTAPLRLSKRPSRLRASPQEEPVEAEEEAEEAEEEEEKEEEEEEDATLMEEDGPRIAEDAFLVGSVVKPENKTARLLGERESWAAAESTHSSKPSRFQGKRRAGAGGGTMEVFDGPVLGELLRPPTIAGTLYKLPLGSSSSVVGTDFKKFKKLSSA
jgi:hypothetical protein